MLISAANKATLYLAKWNVIEPGECDIYAYGLELMLSSFINTLLIVILSFLFGRPFDALIYMMCSRPIRRYGGGWHAPNHLICITLQCATFTAVSWLHLILYRYISIYVVAGIFVFFSVLAWLRAPVEHPDNPIQLELRSDMKRKCLGLNIACGIFAVLSFLFLSPAISILICLSVLAADFTLLFRNRERAK